MTTPVSAAEQDLADMLPRLHLYFRVRGWAHEAEDLASEVTIRVLATLRKGDAIQHVGAFSLGTARLVLLERLRRGPEPVPLTDQAEPPAPEAEPEPDEERLVQLRACLDLLGPRERELMLAYYGEGSGKGNRARLAEQLGISLNAVHIKACRLRGQMRECMEKHGTPSGAVAR